MSEFSECTTLISIDDKAKVKIGIPAVSKFVYSRKYFIEGKGPHIHDHDFPIGSKCLIIPSGFFSILNIFIK